MNVGIFAPWGKGDLIISSGVLSHKDRLWPNSRVIWFASPENASILAGHPKIAETRIWPFRWAATKVTWMLARGDSYGKLTSKKHDFPELNDLDLGYFSTPWLSRNAADELALVPKVVFGLSPDDEWLPNIHVPLEEGKQAQNLVTGLPFRFSVMLETEQRSGQSCWDDSMSAETMRICRETLGECNFIFASPGAHRKFAGSGVTDCSTLNFRQCLSVYNMVDFFVGISSGISCLTTDRTAGKDVMRLEFCGGYNSSTIPLSKTGVLVTNKEELFSRMKTMLQVVVKNVPKSQKKCQLRS